MADHRLLEVARANLYGTAVLTAALVAALAVVVTRPDNWAIMLTLAGLLAASGALRLRETAQRRRREDGPHERGGPDDRAT